MGKYSCAFSLLSIHAILTKLIVFPIIANKPTSYPLVCWEHVAQTSVCISFFLQEASRNLFLKCQMHMNVAPNSLWYMSFPQGSAGVPGQPGEPGKEGKRVSKQSTSCVAWLVLALTARTWPRERPNSSWLAVVVSGRRRWSVGLQREKGRRGLVVWQLMNGPSGQGVTHAHSMTGSTHG